MKKRFQIILALVLTACLMAGMLPAAAAESAQELVDAPVITASKTPVTGRFLRENGAVYVSEETLLQMAPGIEVACSGGSHEIYVGRPAPYVDRPGFSWAEFSIAADEVHYAEEGLFFPFSTVMEQLKLNPVVMEPGEHLPDYPQGCLLILEAGDMDRLGQLMLSIFEEPCYCMRYWKDSENYRTDVKLAELISALRDRRMFEFDAGQMTLNGYRDANAMEPEQVKLLFENTYSDGQLVNVQLYNILGTLLGEGPTAADAADAVGMRMMVEQAMPY